MSLHIEGKYHLIDSHAVLRVLGRIPVNIVSVLGNIGSFSISQLFNNQNAESVIERMMSDNVAKEDIEKIPALANHQESLPTREFIVIIDGLLNNVNAVKYFKWAYKN